LLLLLERHAWCLCEPETQLLCVRFDVASVSRLRPRNSASDFVHATESRSEVCFI
jgi:hypothetical protein